MRMLLLSLVMLSGARVQDKPSAKKDSKYPFIALEAKYTDHEILITLTSSSA